MSPQLRFISRRSPVYGLHGMVATSQPLASEIGLRILRQGGNAIDAAIAIAAALSVTEPCSTGIGGDCFILYYHAESKKVMAVNGSGRSPKALTLERVRQDCGSDIKQIPITHPHAVTVPGAVAGWIDALDKWGTCSRLTVLQPAIDLAEGGFPVSPVTAHHWERGEAQLRSGPHGEDLMLGGKAPEAGQVFTNAHLGQCFREIARDGKAAFYQGPIGERIVELIQSFGGVLSMEDLASHRSSFPEPIKTTFRGVDVYETPPNSQGLTALMALNILSECFPNDEPFPAQDSAQYYHYVIEALRLAFAETRWYVSDPAFQRIPVDELLSAEYAASQAALIQPGQACVDPERGSPVASSDTVSFQVIDTAGNAVSMVNSNYTGFGTGLVPAKCGFSLQSRGSNFSLEAAHPNALAPNKRPYHTIIPCLTTYSESQELHATLSVMGGFMQPQGHVQMILNLVAFDWDAQEALDVRRICIGSGHHGSQGQVNVEEGGNTSIWTELSQDYGHPIQMSPEGHGCALFGRGQIITKDRRTGVLCAGSDGRADGCAMGW